MDRPFYSIFTFEYLKICCLRISVAMTCATLYIGCGVDANEKLFKIRKGSDIGIDFQNTIVTNDSLNALTFEYIYNGSGVGVGDFNLDGLPDLFFGGNQTSSRLYLNLGGFQFNDVTASAGITTSSWVTGVSVVDINNDGLPDVYLSVGGMTTAENRRNLLFLHQGLVNGIPTFKEFAVNFGLADDGYGTMAAFFDYDLDGDLDVYIVNNWLEKFNRNNLRPKRVSGEAESTDRLYRNNGDDTFTDVSQSAGILIEGYGLGVVICDINQDFWPDVYVSNDFMSNDLLWINQGDGTFTNQIGDYLKHQSHNGMGVDIADFNNDGLMDIAVVDMLPPDHLRQKMMTPGQNYDHFHMSLDLDYQPQYMRNTLQVNRGKMLDGNMLFSETAFMSGVAQTDWSWAPLFADFDNDGWKDLFIANGYRKDVTDLDFIFFHMEGSPFGTDEVRRQKYNDGYSQLAEVKLNNVMFQNSRSLKFEDRTKAWGFDIPTFSNGAVYVDLDNDGDLDLITNNIDQDVLIYENLSNKVNPENHFIKLSNAEPGTLQQKIWLYAKGEIQHIENTPYRGFQSTVDHTLHFGVGAHTRIDSIIVIWPDSTAAVYKDIAVDTLIKFSKKDARPYSFPATVQSPIQFVKKNAVDFKHQERSASDIKTTRTLLHELTRYGPCLATGDVNGDGLDDFLVGGEGGDPTQLFTQNDDGTFDATLFPTLPDEEVGAALFFDADGDGDLDLYLAKSSSFSQIAAKLHVLYQNDGKGNFTKSTDALPAIATSASCVEAADFNGDGMVDLFIGGRLEPGAYPTAPRSYVLKNTGGKFIDVTAQVNTALLNPGMVSSAVWADIDNDKLVDLIITGEWMPIQIFKNTGSAFIEVTEAFGLQNTNGWWNCVQVADLNNDGYLDLVAGNAGNNSYFKSSLNHPVQLISKDFDGNGSIDPLITYYNPIEKNRFVVHNRLVLIDQIPGMKRRFDTFGKFAETPFDKSFTKEELNGSTTHSVYTLSSMVLLNNQGKNFQLFDLPDIAQISTVNDILIDDLNHDGFPDIVAIGNMYAQETLFGRYDALLGTVLLGDGKMNWKSLPPHQSNFIVDGDTRNVQSINIGSEKALVITQNNGELLFYYVRVKGVGANLARVEQRLKR